jgi:hypothetical protein
MGLTNEQVGMLIDKFVITDQAKSWREQRLRDHERWTKWTDPSRFAGISDDELKKQFLEYFNEGAGRYSFNAIYRDRIVREMAAFRHTLMFLLDESVPVEQRVNEVLETNGRHRLPGIGKGLATSLLMDLDPSKYATWNNKTEMGLEALGRMPEFERGNSWGQRYKKVMQELGSMKWSRPDVSFIDFDHLLHIVAVEEEGIEAVRRIKEGTDIRTQAAAPGDSSIKVAESMEFAMEKYLEEFIEANFDKINFGAKLELYQDEDSTGRQYPTSIGPIDLLAFDKEKKEFLVIELKRGKGSDAVIGQVLRYMGWVKENLADGREVKGIVIQKELDEKLQYALKMIPGVSAFLYTVSFDINKVG